MQVEELELRSGSGTTVQDINKFMNSFEMTQKMMKKVQNGKALNNIMKNIDPQQLKKFK